MVVFWGSKVKDCQHSPLYPPQDPQHAKRYLSQVSMEEHRKRVLADALPLSSIFRWRSLCGKAISIYLFVSIYSESSSQFISHKAVQPSLENHNFLIAFNLFPTLLFDTPSSSAGRHLCFLPPWHSWLCNHFILNPLTGQDSKLQTSPSVWASEKVVPPLSWIGISYH